MAPTHFWQRLADVGGHTTSPSPSRLESWLGSWRVSLRMARRDVRRHRGRSILIVVMVGLPVLLLTAGSTLWFSENLDQAERTPFLLANTQGYLLDPAPNAMRQLLDPHSLAPDQQEAPARPVPGYRPGHEEAALEQLVGGRLYPITSIMGSARVGGHSSQVGVLGIDPRSIGNQLAPRVSLDFGRWPRTSDEVVVTDLGLAAGLPATGTMELRVMTRAEAPPRWRTVSVVGVGSGYASWAVNDVHPAELIGLPSIIGGERQWLVDRSTPITWTEVDRLNQYGVGAYSRYVADHPDTMRTAPGAPGDDERATLYVVGAASVGLLLLTTLLAGPAFAVGAARQRRTLALAASNGATRVQLRRTVLAQALVLGVLSAVTGAVLGVAGGLVTTRVAHAVAPGHFFGPAQVSWRSVAIVTVSGIVSSVVAALIPSRGLGRLDIVSVLRGQSVSARLRRRVPVVGLVLVATGVGAVSLASFGSDDRSFVVFLGGVLLIVVGALLVVPLILALGARVAHRLPLPARMAAREAGRLRGRATPTVAAIMGGAAVLATVCIGLQADTERGARTYQQQLPQGQAIVYPTNDADAVEIQSVVRSADPSLHVLTPRLVTPVPEGLSVRLAAERPGCSFRDTAPELVPTNAAPPAEPTLPRCATVGTETRSPGAQVLIVDVAEFADFAGLDEDQRSALTHGAVAILDPAEAAKLPPTRATAYSGPPIEQARPLDLAVSSGTSPWWRYSVRYGTDGIANVIDGAPQVVSLPVVTLTHAQWLRTVTTDSGGPGVLIPEPVADRLGIVAGPAQTYVRGDGALSLEQESRLRDAMQARFPDALVFVERGYQRDDTLIIGMLIAVISLIILVATLISTALAQAEAAPLLGTLAAVGATRRTRRSLAAAQAVYLALLGAVLGVLVGIAPGIAISRTLTASYDKGVMDFSTVIISIPWLQILLPVLLVPIVAGALAWVSIRRAPTVVRRVT